MSEPHLHDVAIAGLGAMGSAAAFALARRGVDVIGFDRFTPPHTLGSSHGDTRIIREAYFEDPVYVPMVLRAYEGWRELEALSGQALLKVTGGLMIGAPGGVLVEGARRSAELHGLAHEMLSAGALRERFPVLVPEPGMVAVWEPRAGVLAPEAGVAAQLALARAHGATLCFDEPVRAWRAEAGGVRISTEHGEHRARRLVIAAGAWVHSLLPGRAVPLHVERQVQHWFEPAREAAAFGPERCPVHLWQIDGSRFFYGLPDVGAGVKLAFHHGGETGPVESVRREVAPEEVDDVRDAARRFVPAAEGPLRRSAVCLYTNSPDDHFWIDELPGQPEVLVASPCSGHGFKFAPVIGEIVADRLQGRSTKFDIARFRWR